MMLILEKVTEKIMISWIACRKKYKTVGAGSVKSLCCHFGGVGFFMEITNRASAKSVSEYLFYNKIIM